MADENHISPTSTTKRTTAAVAAAVMAVFGLSIVSTAPFAAADTPDGTQDTADYSNALDNVLVGTNALGQQVAVVWNPVASQTGGALPTFTSTSSATDLTSISALPSLLGSIANTPLPTGVPGVIPSIDIPGQGITQLPLPTTIPGASALTGFSGALNALLTNPVLSSILGQLPPLSQVVQGLTATQNNYQSGYSWPLLQLSGQTTITNTFLQTPSGLTVNIPANLNPFGLLPSSVQVLPSGSLPQATAWLPVGAGNYQLPLGASTGWWASAPTLSFGGAGVPSTVASLPMFATGAQAPLNLGSAGLLTGNALLPTQDGLYSPVGGTLASFAAPGLGLAVQNLDVTSGNYIGTNGININNGQNVLLITTPLTGATPIPIVYSLGGFNIGAQGAGVTLPSLFGVGLAPTLQIGQAAGPDTPDGVIPTTPFPVGSIIPTQLVTLTGLISSALGAHDPTTQIGSALSSVYTSAVTPIATQISNLLTQNYGSLVNTLASNVLAASTAYRNAASPTQSNALAAANPLPALAPTTATPTEKLAPAAAPGAAATPGAATPSGKTPAPSAKASTNNAPVGPDAALATSSSGKQGSPGAAPNAPANRLASTADRNASSAADEPIVKAGPADSSPSANRAPESNGASHRPSTADVSSNNVGSSGSAGFSRGVGGSLGSGYESGSGHRSHSRR